MKNLIASRAFHGAFLRGISVPVLFLHWNPAVAAVLSVLLYFAFGSF